MTSNSQDGGKMNLSMCISSLFNRFHHNIEYQNMRRRISSIYKEPSLSMKEPSNRKICSNQDNDGDCDEESQGEISQKSKEYTPVDVTAPKHYSKEEINLFFSYLQNTKYYKDIRSTNRYIPLFLTEEKRQVLAKSNAHICSQQNELQNHLEAITNTLEAQKRPKWRSRHKSRKNPKKDSQVNQNIILLILYGRMFYRSVEYKGGSQVLMSLRHSEQEPGSRGGNSLHRINHEENLICIVLRKEVFEQEIRKYNFFHFKKVSIEDLFFKKIKFETTRMKMDEMVIEKDQKELLSTQDVIQCQESSERGKVIAVPANFNSNSFRKRGVYILTSGDFEIIAQSDRYAQNSSESPSKQTNFFTNQEDQTGLKNDFEKRRYLNVMQVKQSYFNEESLIVQDNQEEDYYFGLRQQSIKAEWLFIPIETLICVFGDRYEELRECVRLVYIKRKKVRENIICSLEMPLNSIKKSRQKQKKIYKENHSGRAKTSITQKFEQSLQDLKKRQTQTPRFQLQHERILLKPHKISEKFLERKKKHFQEKYTKATMPGNGSLEKDQCQNQTEKSEKKFITQTKVEKNRYFSVRSNKRSQTNFKHSQSQNKFNYSKSKFQRIEQKFKQRYFTSDSFNTNPNKTQVQSRTDPTQIAKMKEKSKSQSELKNPDKPKRTKFSKTSKTFKDFLNSNPMDISSFAKTQYFTPRKDTSKMKTHQDSGQNVFSNEVKGYFENENENENSPLSMMRKDRSIRKKGFGLTQAQIEKWDIKYSEHYDRDLARNMKKSSHLNQVIKLKNQIYGKNSNTGTIEMFTVEDAEESRKLTFYQLEKKLKEEDGKQKREMQKIFKVKMLTMFGRAFAEKGIMGKSRNKSYNTNGYNTCR